MDIPIEIKKVFLSFVQQYFQTKYRGLVWNVDIRRTQIFIGDKNAVAPEIVEKMPSIVLNRGGMTYLQTSIDQTVKQTLDSKTKHRADLVRATLTLACLSSNGLEAENIASKLFTILVAYKDEFRQHGIHQIMGISMGEEQMIRGDSVERLYMVPVNITFVFQVDVASTTNYYDLTLTAADGTTTLIERLDYTISGGNYVVLTMPLHSGVNLRATYTGALTLSSYVSETPSGIYDGLHRIYSLYEAVYGYGYLMNDFTLGSGLVMV